MRTLPERISLNRKEFMVERRLEDNIQDLSKSLRSYLEEDKNINTFLQKHLSALTSLPRDNIDPFKEDIISLANMDPLQVLILGRAKSGKTSLAKALSKEFKLVHISVQSVLEKLI